MTVKEVIKSLNGCDRDTRYVLWQTDAGDKGCEPVHIRQEYEALL